VREEELLLADAQTSGGLLLAGEIPGAPLIGELVARGSVREDAVIAVREISAVEDRWVMPDVVGRRHVG
jgi:hypothetical protein